MRADEAGLVGQRVRVKTAKATLTGRLAELRADALVVERQHGQGVERLEVPKAQVASVERSVHPSQKTKGLVIGLVAGVGAAVAIGLAEGDDCKPAPGPRTLENAFDSSFLCFDHTTTGLASAILTVPLGALLGHVIAPGEKWEPVAGAPLSVQPLVMRDGGGIRVALRF